MLVKIIATLFNFQLSAYKSFEHIIVNWFPSLPQEQMHWSEDEDFQVSYVRQCMARNRCLNIKGNFHFNDNSLLHTQDNQTGLI